jgi:predicted dehydrogenase
MLLGGPEAWHPNADMFYREGGEPLLDIAPYPLTAIATLLGPVAAATGFATTLLSERMLAVGPRLGERFLVEVPTRVTAALRLERGPFATLTTSFEATGQYETMFVINSTEGSLRFPDPNDFGGDLQLRHGQDEWTTVAYESLGARDTRGLGLHEMLEAMATASRTAPRGNSPCTCSRSPTRCCARPPNVAPFRLPPEDGDVRTRVRVGTERASNRDSAAPEAVRDCDEWLR